MKPFVHKTALVETDQIGDDTKIWAFAHVMAGAVKGQDVARLVTAYPRRG